MAYEGQLAKVRSTSIYSSLRDQRHLILSSERNLPHLNGRPIAVVLSSSADDSSFWVPQHSHEHAEHGHTHEHLEHPGKFTERDLPDFSHRDFTERAFTVGIGGPVGSGKTALMLALCKRLRSEYSLVAVTNDIFTAEDWSVMSSSFWSPRVDALLSASASSSSRTTPCPPAAFVPSRLADALTLPFGESADVSSRLAPSLTARPRLRPKRRRLRQPGSARATHPRVPEPDLAV